MSLFLLTIARSGRLAEIGWSVCNSKSQRSLCISFSRTEFRFIIIIITRVFSTTVRFHWCLSNKFTHESWTLLSILSDLNPVVFIVSILLLISNFSSAFNIPNNSWYQRQLYVSQFFQLIIIIIIIIIIIYSLEFFTSALADDFSLESEWQQVSSSLQDSSQYSGCSQ